MWFSDYLGNKTDDYTAKIDGTIKRKRTNDKFDQYYIENKKGSIEFVDTFNHKKRRGLRNMRDPLHCLNNR